MLFSVFFKLKFLYNNHATTMLKKVFFFQQLQVLCEQLNYSFCNYYIHVSFAKIIRYINITVVVN